MNYKVAEQFYSIQGEGLYSGKPAYFVRLYGCNVKCSWCDSKYSWQDGTFDELSTQQIVDEINKHKNVNTVIITGGEPCMYDLSELCKALKAQGIRVHLETSGTLEIRGDFDFIALSPKLHKGALAQNLSLADEIKCIVAKKEDLAKYKLITKDIKDKTIWLTPEYTKANDKDLLLAMYEFVMEEASGYRLSWQLHKNYDVR